MSSLCIGNDIYLLSDNMKEWLLKLFDSEIEECSVASSNEHLWSLGSSGESAVQHEENAKELIEYIEIIRALKNCIK